MNNLSQITNQNFIAYAKAHGNTPERQLGLDHEAFPGGVMVGFMLWINAMRTRCWRERREIMFDRNRIGNVDAWVAFLQGCGEKGITE